jgi:hypothetical protein
MSIPPSRECAKPGRINPTARICEQQTSLKPSEAPGLALQVFCPLARVASSLPLTRPEFLIALQNRVHREP